jgi:hypothetical protein
LPHLCIVSFSFHLLYEHQSPFSLFFSHNIRLR